LFYSEAIYKNIATKDRELEWSGKDADPLIREAINKPEIYNEEQVRNEMFLHFNYHVTESSGHNSEYNAWFRKRKDVIEKYRMNGTGWNPGSHDYILDKYLLYEENWKKDIDAWMANDGIDLKRGHGYAAYIFKACDGTIFEFNANVHNFGLIGNPPEGCCVEVPVLVSKRGINPRGVGKLPDHLAVLVNTSALCGELAVEVAIDDEPCKVFHTICMDPLASAQWSLAEIKSMSEKKLKKTRHTCRKSSFWHKGRHSAERGWPTDP